ncbi:MAG: phosphate transport regulator [Betaproteobacteria bacterium CG2_30_59_46]|nr:MAG: phosphate transport regulator [Betaproteobacteria bacterium CG2_30_59_46]PIY01234.1 MAG: DUF47 domain-containing protein [Hydrogenophilales bacterium CG_4_10_14_3_um_filter_58_23]PJB04697.1 MAG: DUF47 domain-containing protein [Hydrogenophilales bacterium CG_4_9_14_3_um_filter_59_35]
MREQSKFILSALFDQVFPKTPNFFKLLTEQCLQVSHSVNDLVEFLKTGDEVLGKKIKQDEHEADLIKMRNIHILNEAFSTPIDREDIYRAIADLDRIVTYCKTTVSEMDVLGVTPDTFIVEISKLLQEGVDALVAGFGKLGSNPLTVADDADIARKAQRRVERLYRIALAELFKGDDYINMFKRREIYRHLSNAAHNMAHCANTLHDIVVKIC